MKIARKSGIAVAAALTVVALATLAAPAAAAERGGSFAFATSQNQQ